MSTSFSTKVDFRCFFVMQILLSLSRGNDINKLFSKLLPFKFLHCEYTDKSD
jgi:hypothetical protein